MPRDGSNRVAIWIAILVSALVLVGVLLLCGQCLGGSPINPDTGPGY